MTRSIPLLISLGSLLLAAGCSGTTAPSNSKEPIQPGCGTYPECGTCGTCFESCFCQTGDNTKCLDVCVGGGNTGTGGASAFGAGGSTFGAAGSTSTFGAGGSTSTVGAGGSTSTVGAGGSTLGAAGATTTGAGGTPVTPPAEQTYTFTTTAFDVAPGQELYKAQDFKNPFGKDVAIIKSVSTMTPQSHHMFAFHDSNPAPFLGTPIQNADGPLMDSTGVEFHPYIHTAQTPEQTITYPAGVARSYPGNQGLRLQMHYINQTTSTISAVVSLRVWYVDPSTVPNIAAEVFLNQANLGVPVGTSTETGVYAMPLDINLIGAASHMHKHATNFDSKTGDGRALYTTTQWDEPTPAAFDPGMPIAKGQTISWGCTFNNDSGAPLSFGEHALTNEMCIFSGLYYPAPGGVGITTQCLGAAYTNVAGGKTENCP